MTDIAINPAPFLKNAGFTGDLLLTATAIIGAESSFIPTKYNAEADFFTARGILPSVAQNEGSKGLAQIFQYEHPEFFGWNLFDPQVNACAMHDVWFRAGKSFNPWSTYRIPPAAYKAHLTQAGIYVAQVTS